MLLAVDIGNTTIKTALFDEDQLISHINCASVEEIISIAESEKLTDTVVSSVVPGRLDAFNQLFFNRFGKEPLVINRHLKFDLKIDYKTPETLGVDRICSSEGAFTLYKKSPEFLSYNNQTYIVVLDFGTATTVNFISYPGIFVGGMILPGMKMMFTALKTNTAMLPMITESEYDSFIGKSTHESISSGVLNAQAGIADRVVSFIKETEDFPFIRIYITGGVSKFIMPLINHTFNYEPNLVLLGINSIYLKNRHKWKS